MSATTFEKHPLLPATRHIVTRKAFPRGSMAHVLQITVKEPVPLLVARFVFNEVYTEGLN